MIIADRYKIQRVLGKGGVGTTYEATDIKSDRLVAVKELSLRQSQDRKVIELFEREAKTLAKLDHPHIPRYLDFFAVDTESDRYFYLVRELAVGESLADLVDKGWRSNEDGLRNIVAQVLEILVYLHELNPPVIHRDIKPSNLIYQPDLKKIFLIDFGAVQDAYSNAIAGGGTFVGTFGYMAPEQLRGETGVTADLYSLGMTLIFLLTHRAPSDLPQKRMKIDLLSTNLGISNEFLRWLDKVIEPIPEDRFPTAKIALESLNSGVVERIKKPNGTKIKLEKTRDRLFIRAQPNIRLIKINLFGFFKYMIIFPSIFILFGAIFGLKIVILLGAVPILSLGAFLMEAIYFLLQIEITIDKHLSYRLRRLLFGIPLYSKTIPLEIGIRVIIPLKKKYFNLTNIEINWLVAEINNFLKEESKNSLYPDQVQLI